MLKIFPTVSALALLALTAPAFAQDSTATQTEEAPAAQTEEGTAVQTDGAATATEQGEDAQSGEGQLDLGSPVGNGEPQLGDRYSKEKFGDWDLACIKTEAEQDPCSLLQILTDQQGNPMAEFSLFRIKNGSQAVAGATVIVPLETLLPAQLTISVDNDPGKRYNYSFCNPIGCIAQIGLTEEDVNAFKRGAKAKISLRPAPAPDQKVDLELSLKGFTAGFDAVDVVDNQ